MSALIEDLKREHSLIVNVLNSVRELGIGTEEGKEKLLTAKRDLLAHLRREDEELYPVLKKAAADDQRLGRILENFASDMEEVSRNTLRFFEKYEDGGSDIEFARDFGSLFSILGMRINREESILFEEYDNLT